MPKQQTMIFDGTKAVPPWDFENDKGWVTLSGEDKLSGIDLFIARVPWLYRSIMDRANCVSAMPWYITRGDEDYDSFGEYENKLGWLPNPRRLFSQLEQSLAVAGKAYIFLETNNGGYIKGIQYCNPYTVTEVYDKDGKLSGYKRRIGSRQVEYPVENFVAIYAPDYLTETGPGKFSAAGAALMAAGVTYNSEGFIQQFFARGAIKATVLTALNTGQPEAERLQHWWDDVVSGIRNAWSAIVLRSEGVKATTIGEGLESLQNDKLTREQRQEISTALGIPESRLWSAAANYATRQMDEVSYYTGTIIPDCDLITDAFKSQVFNKAHRLEGYLLEARHESMDIFQVDNAEQAGAYSQYVSTGMKPSVAAQILGIELPAGMEYEDLDPEEEPEPEPVVMPIPPEPEIEEEPEEVEATEQEIRSVLKAWRKKAELAFKKTGSAEVEFVTRIIPHNQQEAIRAALAAAKSQDEIRAAMDATDAPKVDYELKALAEQLNQAWAALKAEPPTITIPPINYPPMTVNISMPNMEPQITVTPSTAEIRVEPAQPQILVSPTPVEVNVEAPVTVQPAQVNIAPPQVVRVNRDKAGEITSLEAE